jgi:hypothetical protein
VPSAAFAALSQLHRFNGTLRASFERIDAKPIWRFRNPTMISALRMHVFMATRPCALNPK